jgi:hypothetical protein
VDASDAAAVSSGVTARRSACSLTVRVRVRVGVGVGVGVGARAKVGVRVRVRVRVKAPAACPWRWRCPGVRGPSAAWAPTWVRVRSRGRGESKG